MPTSTRNKNNDTVVIEPNETAMFEREGLDRKGIRRELANVAPLSLDDLYVERDDVTYIDPRTTEMPYGPTGLGEFGGSGIETVRIEGEEWKTFRYVSGYETLEEDAGNDEQAQVAAILEQFDFLADANFLKGVEDQNGNQIRQGVFSWLDSSIPSNRTLDCSNFIGDASSDPDLTGTEEDILTKYAFDEADFRLLDPNNPRWDTMIGRRDAISQFQQRSGSEGGEAGDTYWERLSDEGSPAGVNNRWILPEELQLDILPDDSTEDPFVVDLTTELGDNEVILLPDRDSVANNYWRLGEMPTPEVFGPYDERGGKTAVDYVYRYSHQFNPNQRYGDAPDAIRLQNVDQLFA